LLGKILHFLNLDSQVSMLSNMYNFEKLKIFHFAQVIHSNSKKVFI